MSLLKAVASLPKYETILPESGIRVEYRPFIMKEEKILLMAAETKNEKAIYSALREMVLACTENSLDIMNLSPTDLEYLFLRLRINSIGDKATPSVKCLKCGEYNEVDVMLSDIQVVKPEDRNNVIKVSSQITVHMRSIVIKDMISLSSQEQNQSQMDQLFDALARSIEKVFVGDVMYDSKDYTQKEMVEFIDSLTQPQVVKLLEFIEKSPRMECNVKFKCKKCEADNNTMLRGITSFF